MADALVSGASVRKDVEVQLLSAAPINQPSIVRASASLDSMNEPLALMAGATGGLGLATFIAGRRVFGWPKWSLSSRGFRIAGAYGVLESAIVFVLLQAGNVGFAWIVFALGSLSGAAAVSVAQRRSPST
jgi:hypothetical protein